MLMIMLFAVFTFFSALSIRSHVPDSLGPTLGIRHVDLPLDKPLSEIMPRGPSTRPRQLTVDMIGASNETRVVMRPNPPDHSAVVRRP